MKDGRGQSEPRMWKGAWSRWTNRDCRPRKGINTAGQLEEVTLHVHERVCMIPIEITLPFIPA
jgi:hypothetical protein